MPSHGAKRQLEAEARVRLAQKHGRPVDPMDLLRAGYSVSHYPRV